jgi:hypothetical protein
LDFSNEEKDKSDSESSSSSEDLYEDSYFKPKILYEQHHKVMMPK